MPVQNSVALCLFLVIVILCTGIREAVCMAAPHCDAMCFLVRLYCVPISMATVCVSGPRRLGHASDTEWWGWILVVRGESKVADWTVTAVFFFLNASIVITEPTYWSDFMRTGTTLAMYFCFLLPAPGLFQPSPGLNKAEGTEGGMLTAHPPIQPTSVCLPTIHPSIQPLIHQSSHPSSSSSSS